MNDAYADILQVPRHESTTHMHMKTSDRAAQFSPFAALSGYGDAILETARLTNKRIELDECIKEDINDRLHKIADQIKECPDIEITYFQPDQKKNGGAYTVATGAAQKVDSSKRVVVMPGDVVIPFDEIIGIDGQLFGTEYCE